MLISFTTIANKCKLNIKGILHIGAHDCQEESEYVKYCQDIVWIEGNKSIVDRQNKSNMFHALISNKDDEIVTFHISNNEQSSSILELGTHKTQHPNIVYTHSIQMPTTRIDTFYKKYNIVPNRFNFINLDIQGMELQALESFGDILNHVDYIYTEVNRNQTYKNCALIEDIDDYLKLYKFKRIETKWGTDRLSWGDAFYIKEYIHSSTYSF
jgi:FkbM family methyltransferase